MNQLFNADQAARLAKAPTDEQLLQRALEAAGDAIVITDRKNCIVWANRAFSMLSGYAAEELPGINFKFFSGHPGHSERTEEILCDGNRKGMARRLVRRHRDGTIYVTEETVSSVRDGAGEITHFVSILHDVTQSSETLMRERQKVRQDDLTGLASRSYILELLNSALAQAEQAGQLMALLFIDLDGFKIINDERGHHVGDAVLQVAASRILAAVRCSDTVARYGGDEFLILLPSVTGCALAKRICEDVLQQINHPIVIGSEFFELTASVGVSFYPTNGALAESLIISADAAMYRAKRAGGNQIRMAHQF